MMDLGTHNLSRLKNLSKYIGPKKKDHVTHIGAHQPLKFKEQLTHFLKENRDDFANFQKDMPGIDPEVMSHKLNINSS